MNPTHTQLTKEVIDALNDELKYQDSMAGTQRADTMDSGVAGQVVALSRYARKAEDAWTDNAGDEAALDALRKCAAIAVRALIKYGCPKRKG